MADPATERRAAAARARLLDHPLLDTRFKSPGYLTIAAASQVLFENSEPMESRDAIIAHRQKMAAAAGAIGAGAPAVTIPREVRALWRRDGLVFEREVVVSEADGNAVTLSVIRPAAPVGSSTPAAPIPCVVYLHGGGMASNSAFDPTYQVFARILARQGVAVVLPDFRNCEVPTPSNPRVAPYPAGLNDCYAALEWVHANKERLGADRRIVLAGESGGANLAIAIALKCKRAGRSELTAHGFYAMCPYIAGNWPQGERDTGVLGATHLDTACNGVVLKLAGNGNCARGYGMEAYERRDPLAWPGFASVGDLAGLPRCVVTVDELDPLRDEGVNFARRLVAARVPVIAKSILATPHGGELAVAAVPELVVDTARSIASFARGWEVAHAGGAKL